MRGTVTYEVVWCVHHVDIRDLPDAMGFAMPFLVGMPGEGKVLGVFPAQMGRGYSRQFEKAMQGLGLSSIISFYVTELDSASREVLFLLERNGRPIGMSEGHVRMLDPTIRCHRCTVGQVYYEGLGLSS